MGPALSAGGVYVGKLWPFWLAPIAGAMAAGALSRVIREPPFVAETDVVEKGAA